MPNEFARKVGRRLRQLRLEQGMTLQAVEEKSRGRWPAPRLGSYERADRSIKVETLAELAGFYGSTAIAVLTDSPSWGEGRGTRLGGPRTRTGPSPASAPVSPAGATPPRTRAAAGGGTAPTPGPAAPGRTGAQG